MTAACGEALVTTPQGVAVRHVPRRSAGPDEVVVRVHYAGICGTDLHIAAGHFGERVAPGTVLGHEASGVVDEVGDRVAHWRAGDRVVVHPFVPCGRCVACVRGRGNVCPDISVLGVDTHGALQTHWVVPAACLVALPDDVPLAEAALVEPTAVALRDVRRGEVRLGDRVAVAGAGPVGLLLALLARAAGGRVTVSDVDAGRLAVAAQLQLETADATSTQQLPDVDVAFEASGTQSGLDAMVACLAPGGRVVAVGIHEGPRQVDMHRVFTHELTLVGARLHARDDVRSAIELLAAGAVDVRPLISRVIGLADVPQALERLSGGPDGLLKVLVQP